jgi:hypothetical protein
VEVRVEPERLDRVAEGAGEAAGRGAGPRRVAEGGEEVGRTLGRAVELVGQLLVGATPPLLDLAGGDGLAALSLDLAGHDLGHAARHVGGHVGDRPTRAAAGPRPFVAVELPQQLGERLVLGGDAGAHLLE